MTLRTGPAARLADQLSRAARSMLKLATSSQCGTTALGTEPQASRSVARTDIASTVALVVAASVMLSWVALFNHAPLVFSDTIAYATAALRHEIPGFVSVYYGILILPLHQGITSLASRVRPRSHVGASAVSCCPLRLRWDHRKIAHLANYCLPVLVFKLALGYWRDLAGCVCAGCSSWHIPSGVLQ